MESILFLLPSLIASLMLIGILGYFGIHVLKRGIIFIDIAMAQIAALGVTLAYIFNISTASIWTSVFSFILVVLASFLFALLKCNRPRICIEAIIGISYAVATAVAVILVDKAAGAEEHIKDMLIGSILWVQWPDIVRIGIVFTLVSMLHYWFRDKFLWLSETYDQASQNGGKIQLWDFIFYLSLGVVVMYSVRIAGILIVFAFLIIPSAISALFSQQWLTRIFIGWFIGTFASFLGLSLSWRLDVPAGPVAVLCLGVSLLFATMIKTIRKKISKSIKNLQ